MEGVVSYFPSRQPTNDDIAHCTLLEMTSDAARDPRSQHFRQTETQLGEPGNSTVFMVSTTTQLSGTGTREKLHKVMSSMTPTEILAVASADNGQLAERLEGMVNVSGGNVRGGGICMIGSEHELYTVATSLPDSVITKESWRSNADWDWKLRSARWGHNASRSPEVRSSGGGGSRHDSRQSDIQGCRGSSTQTRCFL
jgi:hypothetical protein